jgi:predicted CoA-binding protein
MDADSTPEDPVLRRILAETHTIAMIGASADPERPSYRVMRYLQSVGYRVIPVNPTIEEDAVNGETVYDSLADIETPFELVDVFRRTEAIPGIVDDVLAVARERGIRYVWLQLGIRDEKSAERAQEAGLITVMDRCMKIEHERLVAK